MIFFDCDSLENNLYDDKGHEKASPNLAAALGVLNGEKPDKAKYREQIKNEQKERLQENREFNGCPLVCV
ncbi:hypothetical protein CW751_11435 [Brumimicrobium salinarum]|uniref:Uncharacterized protein n=1 Tax=Brumimicrobium salinarum TaxID=2058658 RepID=A0A2I0R140_9FLAO|nr:hypothetical protein CW751_11435 [Brumimicrobium salinarum]